MDICDAIDEAERQDIGTPDEIACAVALANDIGIASEQLQQDFQYPVNHLGQVMMLQYMHPDVMPTLVYHMIRRGWRRDDSKALIKPRRVEGSLYDDLVAWVDVNQPDEPIVVDRPTIPDDMSDTWSVRPQVNVIDEERLS